MDILFQAVLVLVPMILALSVHEFFHARAALWLGDPTAANMGRLTLNPGAHIDPFGTLILPMMSILSGSSIFFGWAKPVPVNPMRFSLSISMRKGMMLTALAGPLSNIAFGFVAVFILKAILMLGFAPEAVLMLLQRLIMINFVLAFFNMIPIPPLDGGKVLSGFAPPGLLKLLDTLEANPLYSIIFFVLLFSSGLLGILIGPPVRFLLGLSFTIAGLG